MNNFGMLVKNVKVNDKGVEKITHQFWVRYVPEDYARMRFALKVADNHCAYLVRMVEPQAAPHVCSAECACIAEVIEVSGFAPRAAD